jgi:hypothetical protein
MKKGSALAWAEQKLAEYSTGLPNATPPVAPWAISFADFLIALRASFGDVDRQATARLRLPELKQTRSVDEYNVEFMGQYPLTGFNEEAGIEFYKKGLKTDILRRIYNEPTAPADFAAWRTRASHYDRVDKELRATITPAPKPSSSFKSRHIGSTSSTSAATTPSPAPDKIKQEKVEASLATYRKENNLCIICGKSGHWANVCPDRITKPKDHKGLPSGRGRGPLYKKRTVNNVETSDRKDASGSN